MGSGSESPPAPSREAQEAAAAAALCACDCRRCCSPAAWQRTVKRKVDEMADEEGGRRGLHADVAARVEVEDEVAALRETLASHQQTVQELYADLDEERSASASAASEAMSMILRLQREKAEVQMEARQFKRFAEEKMAHDQQELLAVEDLLYKRDQAVQSLSCELQAYRHRLFSWGIHSDAGGSWANADDEDYPTYNYPPVRCYDNPNSHDYNDEGADHLQNLEHRIYQLERTPSSAQMNVVMEKGVVVGQSPRPCMGHSRKFSSDSLGSFQSREPECNGMHNEEFPATVDRASASSGDDGMSYRVYTIDAVHRSPMKPAPAIGVCEDYVSTPRGSVCQGDGGGSAGKETDIKKLYMRLQALEADRESMRQAIISMGTDKAQFVLLREIAQHLCREVSPPPSPPSSVRKIVRKPSSPWSFSIVSVIKRIMSFVFWKKKAQRSKYMFGLSNNNVGLLLLLDKSPHMRRWRCLTRMRG